MTRRATETESETLPSDTKELGGISPEAPSDSGLGVFRLFRVDLAGAHYWVLSTTGTPASIVAAIEDAEGVEFDREHWERPTESDIREVPEAEARTLTCKTEGEPDTNMWSAAVEQARQVRRDMRGRVVACSEWP